MEGLTVGRRSSKESILDAAERVIMRQGMANTTIEGVAAEAGISKGGLFYHFTSKKDMLMQLMDRYERDFADMRRGIYESLPESSTRFLKATVLACVHDQARKEAGNISSVLSLLDDVEMRQRIFQMKLRIFEEVGRESRCPEKAMLALFATDGLWITQLFGQEVVSRELVDKVIGELLRLIDAEGTAEPAPAAEPEAEAEA